MGVSAFPLKTIQSYEGPVRDKWDCEPFHWWNNSKIASSPTKPLGKKGSFSIPIFAWILRCWFSLAVRRQERQLDESWICKNQKIWQVLEIFNSSNRIADETSDETSKLLFINGCLKHDNPAMLKQQCWNYSEWVLRGFKLDVSIRWNGSGWLRNRTRPDRCGGGVLYSDFGRRDIYF